MHSAAPAEPLYLPASQLVQVADCSVGENSPALHGVQVAEAVDDAVPAGHISQLAAAALELVPASHLVQAEDLVVGENSPAGHDVQFSEAVDAAVPAGHVEQFAAASPELVPASHAEQYTDAAAAWW